MQTLDIPMIAKAAKVQERTVQRVFTEFLQGHRFAWRKARVVVVQGGREAEFASLPSDVRERALVIMGQLDLPLPPPMAQINLDYRRAADVARPAH